MQFEHSSKNYLKIANELIAHLKAAIDKSERRKEWTAINLQTLRDFVSDGLNMTYYPAPIDPTADPSKRSRVKGEFLWDHMSCTEEDVIFIAESEWDSDLGELKRDFEKLLYTRCPIKLMMCGGWTDRDDIAAKLSEYARQCSQNFGPGEIFILFFVGWPEDDGKRPNHEAFMWQVPGEVCRDDGRKFSFQSDWE